MAEGGNNRQNVGDGNVENVGEHMTAMRLNCLDGTNYNTWKLKMMGQLMRDGLWHVIEDEVPHPITHQWIAADRKAFGTILLALRNDQLVNVTDCKTTKQVWITLREMYERKTFTTKLHLMRKLFGMRYTGGSMRQHVAAVREVTQQLSNIGQVVEPGYIIAVLMNSLPESYLPMVTMLEGHKEEDLTVNYVTAKLEDEYERRQQVSSDCHDSNKALQTSHSGGGRWNHRQQDKRGITKKDKKCYFCEKNGHFKSECQAYKRWKEQQQGGSSYNHKGIGKSSNRQERKDESGASARSDQYVFNIGALAGNNNNGRWCVDSGATCHMTNKRDIFAELRPVDVNIYLADGTIAKATGSGEVKLLCRLPEGGVHMVTAKDMLYSPDLDTNLISVPLLTKRGFRVVFDKNVCTIERGKNVIARAVRTNNLYCLEVDNTPEKASQAIATASLQEWHRRLGHRDNKAIRRMVTEDLVSGMIIKGKDDDGVCDHCQKGKMAQKPFPTSSSRAKNASELIHSDVCGPMQTPTPSGNRYLVTFVDDFSRFTVVKLIRTKDQVTDVFKQYVASQLNQKGKKPKILRTDNGKEYVNQGLEKFLNDQGIEHQLTCPYTPQQNGVAERKNRSLIEMARCMLLDADLPKSFWGEAVLAAAHIQNRLPSRSVQRTPYEHWFGSKPDVSAIKQFGSRVLVHVPNIKRQKWDDKAEEGVLLGMDAHSKGYRVWNPKTDRVIVARSVKIIEQKVSMDKKKLTDSVTYNKITDWDDLEPTSEGATDNEPELESVEPRQINEVVIEDSLSDEESGRPMEQRVSTRSTKGIPPKKLTYRAECSRNKEPASWDEMMGLPKDDRHRCMDAVKEELKSLPEKYVKTEAQEHPEEDRRVHGSGAIVRGWTAALRVPPLPVQGGVVPGVLAAVSRVGRDPSADQRPRVPLGRGLQRRWGGGSGGVQRAGGLGGLPDLRQAVIAAGRLRRARAERAGDDDGGGRSSGGAPVTDGEQGDGIEGGASQRGRGFGRRFFRRNFRGGRGGTRHPHSQDGQGGGTDAETSGGEETAPRGPPRMRFRRRMPRQQRQSRTSQSDQDNQGYIKLVASERCGQRTKHIDIHHHYLRDLRDQGIIQMEYCPTAEMVADILTKPLSRDKFEKCCEELGLLN